MNQWRSTPGPAFSGSSVSTPVFVRFSTVAGSRGSTDLARDVRGFAVKFYTEEGIFDLVGNNIPVFFIQDAMKFPDLIHAVKPEPHNEIPQAASAHDTFWDFISLMPESAHMIMWVMSDRAIPRSFRMMEGFGVHTFRFINADAVESSFVKFHWKPLLGCTLFCGTKRRRFRVRILTFIGATFRKPSRTVIFRNGTRRADRRREDEHQFDFRPSRSYEDHSRRTLVPVRKIGRMYSQSKSRQLLCRNRTGRFPSGTHRSGHRFHKRSATAGPALFLYRHAVDSVGRTELSRNSQSTDRSRRSTTISATGTCGRRSIKAGPPYEPNSLGRRVSVPG